MPQAPAWFPPFQNAFGQLKEGQLGRALREFSLLWKAYPQDVQLATSIGGVLDATSHHDQATVWYERALAIQPDFGPALADLALNCTVHGKFSEAADLLRRKLKKEPNDTKAAFDLSVTLLRLQRYSEAASVLSHSEAVSDDPVPITKVRLAKATALFHLGRYAETANTLRKSGQPDSVAAFELLGSAQALSGDLPASIKTFQEGIATFPDNPDLYFRLTMVFADGRRDEDAKNVLQAGSKRMPNSPLINYGNAVLAEMVGRDEEAITWAQRSIDESEKQPEVWGLLGTLYDHRGKTDDAVKAYRLALEYGGHGPYIGTKYSELLIRSGQYSGAAAELQRLADAYPKDAQVNRALGKLYRAEGKYDQAEACLRRSLSSNANDPQTHYVLAQVLRHEGRTAEEGKELIAFKSAKGKADTIRLLELVEDPK